MQLDQYLLFSIKRECYLNRAWIISAFSVIQETEEQKKISYPGKLIREPFGFFMVNDEGEKVKIETTKKLNEPLFKVTDQFDITREWIPTLTTAIQSIKATSIATSLGTLLVNLIALYKPFKGKFPYMLGKITISEIEQFIAGRLESVPDEGIERKEDVFYVDEYLDFCKAVSFLETLSSLFVHSVTEHGFMPAPGRKEFKKELLKRYEGKLTDPVEMVKFEQELRAFDKEYLKKDPAYGKFMSGKVEGSRTEGFMTMGGQSNNFSTSLEVTPVVRSLEEGFPLDQEGFTAITNTTRFGSFARGAETVNGGVVAKALMRAADSWRITPGDCETTLGIKRVYGEKDIFNIIGRSLIIDGKPILIESLDQAQAFINKKIIVRSPQYCRRPGTQTCEICAGTALMKYPTGLPIPLMEVSGGILADSLKQMHSTKLETVVVDLPSVIS